MIRDYISDIVAGAAAIIFGIFVIDMICEAFLCFSPVSFIRELIKKITHSD